MGAPTSGGWAPGPGAALLHRDAARPHRGTPRGPPGCGCGEGPEPPSLLPAKGRPPPRGRGWSRAAPGTRAQAAAARPAAMAPRRVPARAPSAPAAPSGRVPGRCPPPRAPQRRQGPTHAAAAASRAGRAGAAAPRPASERRALRNSLDDSAFLYALPTAHPRPAPNPSQCLLSGPSLPTTLTQEAASFTWAEPLSIRGAARDLKWPQGNSRRAVATNALLRPRWKWQVAGEPRSNFLETMREARSCDGHSERPLWGAKRHRALLDWVWKVGGEGMVEGALGFLSPAPRPGRQEPRSPGPREPAVSFACCSALTASGRAVVVASPAPLAAKGQGLDRNARPHRLPRRVGRAGIPSGTWAGMPCWFLCPTRTRIHIGSDLAAADTGAAGEGDGSKGKESAVGVQAPVLRNLGGLPGPCHLLLPSFPKPACTMSVSSGEMGPSLTQEILSHLGLVNKPAAWGTLGTLRTFLSFSVDKDVQRLLRAITGRGVDQGAILEVLTNRSREQRQLISQAFRERTQQDLLKSLRVALSGNLEWIVVALLQPLAQSDAQELRKALKGSGSAEDVAVEILATRAPPQLQECLAAYKHSFQVDAEEDIKSETSSILQDLLLALAKGGRDSYSGIIDYNLAEQDVQALRQVEGPWVPIFTQRNPEHLLRVCDLYQWRTGRALEEAVRDRFHGDAQVALLSLASVVRNTPLYFADKLHRALQETEPNYQVLMRILVSRNETDLLSIRAEFKKKFGESLYSSLQRAVKGDCRPALLALCRAEDL